MGARNRVVVPQANPKPLANLDEYLITDRGAHGVVENFEGIEIDKEDGVAALRAALGAIK